MGVSHAAPLYERLQPQLPSRAGQRGMASGRGRLRRRVVAPGNGCGGGRHGSGVDRLGQPLGRKPRRHHRLHHRGRPHRLREGDTRANDRLPGRTRAPASAIHRRRQHPDCRAGRGIHGRRPCRGRLLRANHAPGRPLFLHHRAIRLPPLLFLRPCARRRVGRGRYRRGRRLRAQQILHLPPKRELLPPRSTTAATPAPPTSTPTADSPSPYAP